MEPSRPRITIMFEQLERELERLDRRRACDCELLAVDDVRHHGDAALFELETLERAGLEYAAMTDVQCVLVREAYLSVLAVAELLQRELGMARTDPAGLVRGRDACTRMLDALAPYVGDGERGARLLVLAGLAHAAR